jgi:hypothetical protein
VLVLMLLPTITIIIIIVPVIVLVITFDIVIIIFITSQSKLAEIVTLDSWLILWAETVGSGLFIQLHVAWLHCKRQCLDNTSTPIKLY